MKSHHLQQGYNCKTYKCKLDKIMNRPIIHQDGKKQYKQQ